MAAKAGTSFEAPGSCVQAARQKTDTQTAAQYGIADGDDIVIETKAGRITQMAALTDHIEPRVVSASHGWWFPEGTKESQYDWKSANFNMLTATDILGKEYGTPNLKAIGCRIRKGD